MLHYTRLAEIREELENITGDIVYYGPEEEQGQGLIARRDELLKEKLRLEAEDEEYREGYEAGQSFHMDGTGMRDEWLGRFGAFSRGFNAAGQDS